MDISVWMELVYQANLFVKLSNHGNSNSSVAKLYRYVRKRIPEWRNTSFIRWRKHLQREWIEGKKNGNTYGSNRPQRFVAIWIGPAIRSPIGRANILSLTMTTIQMLTHCTRKIKSTENLSLNYLILGKRIIVPHQVKIKVSWWVVFTQRQLM